MIWHQSGGEGDRTFLLLHGLGATAAVWNGVQRTLERSGCGRWISPDLSGHGQSGWQSHYSVGQLAAEMANLVHNTPQLFVVGHSLGVYVGLALASGWFGTQVDGVLGVGPKINWPQTDLQTAGGLAARPVRSYATSDEAWARYRRVSGLDAGFAPAEEWVSRGVVQGDEGWRLSQDPRTFAVAGAPFATLVASAKARIVLARGERDPMVSTEELRLHVPDACEIGGAGHNAHVERPDAIVALIEQLAENVFSSPQFEVKD